jgi:hypothetical protein
MPDSNRERRVYQSGFLPLGQGKMYTFWDFWVFKVYKLANYQIHVLNLKKILAKLICYSRDILNKNKIEKNMMKLIACDTETFIFDHEHSSTSQWQTNEIIMKLGKDWERSNKCRSHLVFSSKKLETFILWRLIEQRNESKSKDQHNQNE